MSIRVCVLVCVYVFCVFIVCVCHTHRVNRCAGRPRLRRRCVCVRACVRVRACVHVCARTHARKHTYSQAGVYGCGGGTTPVIVCVCLRAFACIHARTHTHAHTHTRVTRTGVPVRWGPHLRRRVGVGHQQRTGCLTLYIYVYDIRDCAGHQVGVRGGEGGSAGVRRGER